MEKTLFERIAFFEHARKTSQYLLLTLRNPTSSCPLSGSNSLFQYVWVGLLGLLLFMGSVSAQGLQFEWAKKVGGPSPEYGIAITVDDSGNVYSLGHFINGGGDFDPGPGTHSLTPAGNGDVYITKLDPNGNFVWASMMGLPYGDEGSSIVWDKAGAIYISGTHFVATITTPLDGDHQTFIHKLDAGTGSTLWSKAFTGDQNFCHSLTLDPTSNLLLTGDYNGFVDFDPGPGQNIPNANAPDAGAYVVKLDSDGELIWVRQFPGGGHTVGLDIASDSLGNVYMAGFFTETLDCDPGPNLYPLSSVGALSRPNAKQDVLILKLNPDGDFIWADQLGGPNIDEGIGMDVDRDGNIYLTGFFRESMQVKTTSGLTALTAVGHYDLFVAKLNTDGSFLWVKGIGSPGLEIGYSVHATPSGGALFVGDYADNADFDPGPGTYLLPANTVGTSTSASFIAQLDASGNLDWVTPFEGDFDQSGNALALDPSGNIYLTGNFRGTVDFDPGTARFELISTGMTATLDGFVLKLGSNLSTGVQDVLLKPEVSVYPNPTTGRIFIRIDQVYPEATLTVHTLLGQTIRTHLLKYEDQFSFELPTSPGIYLIGIEMGDEAPSFFRVIKE